MARKNRRRAEDARPVSDPGSFGLTRTESGADGDWVVQQVPGRKAVKEYRCPGCCHEIRPGTTHVVAWPADHDGGVDERRHWHTACWGSRLRRGLR